MAWNEQELHRWLAQRTAPSCLRTPLGHDAAQLEHPANPVLCVDACVEGVHFEEGTAADLIGHKAAARALSDLAACGATATGLLLGLCAPAHAELVDLQQGIAALDKLGQRYGAPLVGGDVCCTGGPSVWTVTALGTLDHGQDPISRAGGQAGNALVVTGPLGGSLAGRHLTFEPRLSWGRLLVEQGATAMMDVSDGLARDCDRLARQSELALEIITSDIPIHQDAHKASEQDGRSPLDHALNDGEDHELIALLPAERVHLLDEGAALHGLSLIGWARNSGPVGLGVMGESGLETLAPGGWIHGT